MDSEVAVYVTVHALSYLLTYMTCSIGLKTALEAKTCRQFKYQ